eukprot:TRINITY_DN91303_c0_g1_i1.p1 TRINITY_DN91303_c0_g1~~TRINITY_DN91303_c0_g1_i1.p1  ORF type:complete len:173 (+),score=18.18 TRINITY_DN91303_c0_g1_i1:30-548(+)
MSGAMASQTEHGVPVQPEPVSNLDSMCLVGGVGACFAGRSMLGEAGGLPIAKGRALPVRLAGAAVLAASASLRMSAIDSFRQHGTPLAHKQEVQTIVTEGPFAWSRNPMYLGMVGAMSSIGLLMNSWWGVGAALPFAAYLHLYVIPGEEAHLRAKFSSYDDYAQRTPRWLLW